MTDEEKNERYKKKESRKFLVWITWLLIAVITLIAFIIAIIITKTFPESFKEIVLLVLKYFFTVSLTYLGVNVTQKGIYAVKDILDKKGEKSENQGVD